MASISVQTSPRKADSKLVNEEPESPILPRQEERGPVQPLSLDKMAESQQSSQQPRSQGSRAQIRTPEPRASQEHMNMHKENYAERSPSTPGHLPPFDWDDFEARYEEALKKANGQEEELLEEFNELIQVSHNPASQSLRDVRPANGSKQYFNVWASAASAHDTERGVKRFVLSFALEAIYERDAAANFRVQTSNEREICENL